MYYQDQRQLMLPAHLLHATLNFTVLHYAMFMSPVVVRTEYLLVQSEWEGKEMHLLALSCVTVCTYITNMNRLSWNSILWSFTKSCQNILILGTI